MATKKKSADETRHELKMEELQYIRETERLKHEWEKERMRLKNADIKRTILMKQKGRSYA